MANPSCYTYFGNGEDRIPISATTIIIDPSVQEIRPKAFRGCSLLSSIVIPPSVQEIGMNAFTGCEGLQRVEMSTSIQTIGDGAFYGCVSLNFIDLPEGLKAIGQGAFYGCKRLTSITIPHSIGFIEAHAFQGCSSLNEVFIPQSVTTIGRYAFYRCSTLKTIYIPPSVTTIGELAFSECTSVELLIIPKSLVSTAWGAFSRCTSLKSVTLPDTMTSIVWGTFAECKSLVSIRIPDSVTTICSFAFHGCESLSSIDIPSSVQNIDQNAFNGCISLEHVKLPHGITSIAPHTFFGCTSLKSIKIPDTVQIICAFAFYGCASLEEISIPDSVVSIGKSAFHRCLSLKSIVIPYSVSTLQEMTFAECISLQSIDIPDTVCLIGESAFESCSALTSITIPESVTAISWGTFAECTNLSIITIPRYVATICDYAFAECINLVSVKIPTSVTTLAESAFYGCQSLVLINIPSTVKAIAHEKAFLECQVLKDGANRSSLDVTAWLRTRFDELPAHNTCNRPNLTRMEVTTSLEDFHDAFKQLDSIGLSALHVLLLNDYAESEMVEDIIRSHPSSIQVVGPLGMSPLHLASLMPRIPSSVISLLVNSYTADGRLALTVKDENHNYPCTLAIRYIKSEQTVLYIFERFPIEDSDLRTETEKKRRQRLCDLLVEKLFSQPLKVAQLMDPLQRHGFVKLLNSIDCCNEFGKNFLSLIEERPLELIITLAHITDLHGRVALESASKDVKEAFERRIIASSALPSLQLVCSPQFMEFPAKSLARTNGIKHGEENGCNGILVSKKKTLYGVKKFRKLMKRFGIDWKWGNYVDPATQHTCFELCKDVLDNVPHRESIEFKPNTARFLEIKLQSGFHIQFDSSFVFGANFHFFQHIGRIIFEVLKSFQNSENLEINAELRDLSLRAELIRNNPVKLKTFVRQLTEAVACAHNVGVVSSNSSLEDFVRMGSQKLLPAIEAPKEVVVRSKFPSKTLAPDNSSRLSRKEQKRFDTFVKVDADPDPEEWAKIDTTGSRQATFFAVKTYLTEEVLNSEENSHDEGDSQQSSPTSNQAFRIIRKFCPGVPKNCIPFKLVDKVEKFVLMKKTNGIVENILTKKSVNENELREFLKFLKQSDADSLVRKFRRVKKKSSPMTAQWSNEEREKRWKSVKLRQRNTPEKNKPTGIVLRNGNKRKEVRSNFSVLKLLVAAAVANKENQVFTAQLPPFLIHEWRRSNTWKISPFLFFSQKNLVAHEKSPFINPLFRLPPYHRQLCTELFQLSKFRKLWLLPSLPFLHILFPLPRFNFQFWDNLFMPAMHLSEPESYSVTICLGLCKFEDRSVKQE
jgi:BspA type Leucine rich repeat region (6 copies)